MSSFTRKQGQYLSFLYYYTKLDKRPPAEADMQRYFETSPPSVHIDRVPGQARSIRLTLAREALPDLE